MKIKRNIYSEFGKRVFDLLLTFPALLLFLPVLFVAAVLVCLNLGSPIIYKQKRPGKDGDPFILYKFRTMRNNTNRNGTLLPDDKRLTILGMFLRSTSIDELPEMLNVIKGDMSLVGPRPLLIQYLQRYTPEQARRHEVKPGITGWAQVNGRNSIPWEDKFRLDVWYVDNCSLRLDIRIIVMTIWKILKREGISQPDQATMEEFMGSKSHG